MNKYSVVIDSETISYWKFLLISKLLNERKIISFYILDKILLLNEFELLKEIRIFFFIYSTILLFVLFAKNKFKLIGFESNT